MNPDSWFQLPPDMTAWNNAIIETMSRSMPEISSYINAINWSQLDPATGDGQGLVEYMNGVASSPVIVKGCRLAPIDIICTNGVDGIKFYPLSPEFLQKVYADNVIGEPVVNQGQSDESFEGPSRRIQHIKTVDAVKYASVDAARNLLNEICKSASVVDWMSERMPEALLAIHDRANTVEAEKTASAEDLPVLTVAWKENGRYFANGEQLDSSEINALFKLANATEDERQAFAMGVPFVRDFREKTASLYIPVDQLMTDVEMSAEDAFNMPTIPDDSSPEGGKVEHPQVFVTTAYLRTGEAKHGLLFDGMCLGRIGWWPISGSRDTDMNYTHNERLHSAPDILTRETDFSNPHSRHYGRELFICEDGYGFNTSIKTTARLPISIETVRDRSEASTLSIGSVGMVLGKDYVVDFGRIEEIFMLSGHNTIVMYSYVTHSNTEYVMADEKEFFDVNDTILPLMNSQEQAMLTNHSGVNATIKRTHDGRIILDGETYSQINCPYALMSKYAMAYEDAKGLVNAADTFGRLVFEVYEDNTKVAAENYNPDKVKQNRKGTKSGTDDNAPTDTGDTPQPQTILAQTTPENAMSTGYGSPGAGSATNQSANGFGIEPVNSRDLENVTQINSPKVMDAYMMSNLATSDNMASTANLAQTSDSVLEALSHLSKLLFLIRTGAINYLKETDVQVAMSKLTDVANGLGISTLQVGQ